LAPQLEAVGINRSREAARGTPTVGVIFTAEVRAQQRLFRAYACEKRRDEKRGEQHADSRPKGQGPTQRVDDQPQVAGMTDDTIDTRRDQYMPGLDGDQPAEPTTQHKYWIDSQHTTNGEQNDAQPSNSVPVEGPEILPVCVRRQIRDQQPDEREGRDDPAVGTILALAGAQIPLVKSATPDIRKTTTTRAIRAGWEKKAASPPQPRTASPT
jgi:hypothetical protein